MNKFSKRYLPKILSRGDRKKQSQMLLKSRRLYKKGKYYTRTKLASYPHKVSSHIQDAQRIYGLTTIQPNKQLSKATGCSVKALKKIVNKGEGAYFSSGSRPNQTPQSWGIARLASAVTCGKAAVVDYKIIEEGCDHKKRAFTLANKTRKSYTSRTH